MREIGADYDNGAKVIVTLCNKTHEERTALAQRQECLGPYVEHQPIVAE
jgi:hypothetical protein